MGVCLSVCVCVCVRGSGPREVIGSGRENKSGNQLGSGRGGRAQLEKQEVLSLNSGGRHLQGETGSPRAGGPALGRAGPARPRLCGVNRRPQRQVLCGGGGGGSSSHNNKMESVLRQPSFVVEHNPPNQGPMFGLHSTLFSFFFLLLLFFFAQKINKSASISPEEKQTKYGR